LIPIWIAMRTAPSGSVCCRCMCQRGSYDPIGIAAKSTGPSTLPTAAKSVGEYLHVSLGQSEKKEADPVSPRCMNVRGGDESVGFDFTWKPAQSVALVSLGERADQCCR
jgi:hypothetical protein